MVEGVRASQLVAHRFVCGRDHRAARADGHRHDPLLDHAVADRRAGVVRAAVGDRQPLGQAGLARRLRGHGARDVGRLRQWRQQRRVNAHRLEYLAAPPALLHIQHQGSRRVAHVHAQRACQPVAHIVLRQQDGAGLRVRFRVVPAHPQQLRQGEALEGRVRCELHHLRAPPHRRFDLAALRRGALIAPQDRVSQRPPVSVQAHQPVHLSAERDPRDRVQGHLAFGQQVAQARLRGGPPVVRVLFRPAGLGQQQGILLEIRRVRSALLVNQQALRARGADVDSDEVFQRRLLALSWERRAPARRVPFITTPCSRAGRPCHGLCRPFSKPNLFCRPPCAWQRSRSEFLPVRPEASIQLRAAVAGVEPRRAHPWDDRLAPALTGEVQQAEAQQDAADALAAQLRLACPWGRTSSARGCCPDIPRNPRSSPRTTRCAG